MDNMVQHNERLYLDLTESGSRYVTFNCDYIPVFCRQNLSGVELGLIIDICFRYDSERQQPYIISYQKLAEKHSCCKNAVINALKMLEGKHLIKVVNGSERKGRAARGYIPDVENLQDLLKDYVKKSKQT